MAPNYKKIISYIIPPLITAGLCYVLYADIDMAQIRAGIGRCDFMWVAAFLGCNLMAMVCRALRWRLQLRAIGINPGFGVMNRSIFGTYAVNLVFPRLGEIWRCGYIARLAPAPFSGVFGTMVADRLSDTLMVLLICIPAFIISSAAMNRFLAQANVGATVGDILFSWPVLAGVVLLLCAALYVIFAKSRLAQKVRDFVVRTWRGFTVIFAMPRRGRWLLLTFAIWGCYIVSMGCSMAAFPATAALVRDYGFECVLITFVFGSLAMAVPSNGGIGPWQVAIILSLSGLYGLPEQEALVFATLNLAASTLLTILLGLYTFAHIALRRK